MSERSDDEQELVELLLNGSLTPREFERARTALGETGATSINTDATRSAAEPVGVSAASPATAGPSITEVDSTDGHGETFSISSEGSASPRSRTRIPRLAWIIGGSLAVVVLVAMAVPAALNETVELRAGQVVTRPEVEVPFWSDKSSELELLTSGSVPFEVSWAVRRGVKTSDERLRAAPGELVVAIWADERPSEVDSIQRFRLLVDGQPRSRGLYRTLGAEAVVASVPRGADVILEVVSEGQSEMLDLRRGSRALETLEPTIAPDVEDQETQSRANEPDNTSPRNAMGWPTARVEDEPQDGSGAASSSGDPQEPSPDDRQEPPEGDDPREADEAPPTPLTDARFESHIASGQDAVDFARFLTQHARQVVYLDITVPHEGEVIAQRNSSFYIDVDPAEHNCPECAYFYSISFQGDGPPATAQREGTNVRIEGYFFTEDTAESAGEPIPNMLIAGRPVEHALTE